MKPRRRFFSVFTTHANGNVDCELAYCDTPEQAVTKVYGTIKKAQAKAKRYKWEIVVHNTEGKEFNVKDMHDAS